MKEHPILFSTPMVQAILAGAKTQTRRVAKGLPKTDVIRIGLHPDGSQYLTGFNSTWKIECPHGEIGDRLWVRETFRMLISGIQYRADEPLRSEVKWKPSIFMARNLSRITLEIVSIRAERLNAINEEDAIAEGTGSGFQMNAGWPDYTRIKNRFCEATQDCASASYATLWESINGKGSWNQNPWVWVIEFKTVSR